MAEAKGKGREGEGQVPEIQARLDELNGLLGPLLPYKIALLKPSEIEILDKAENARFMRNDTFGQLVANLKKDKALSSVPLIYTGDGGKKCLSGNHRVQAAVAAAVPWVICFIIDWVMTAEEQISVQLSHNSLSGEDDLQVLKRLYDQVQQIDLKAYSGLDEDTIKQLASISYNPISEPRLKFKAISFLFLPAEVEEIKALAAETDKALRDKETYVFRFQDYEEFFKLLVEAKGKLTITNSAVAILELMRIGFAKLEADEVAAKVEANAAGGKAQAA